MIQRLAAINFTVFISDQKQNTVRLDFEKMKSRYEKSAQDLERTNSERDKVREDLSRAHIEVERLKSKLIQ